MEPTELDRAKSLSMLRELQIEHKSIKDNPELREIQKRIDKHKRKDENQRIKTQTEQEIIQETRQRFQNALNKLNSIDTREVALKEARSIIEKNNSLEGLKFYISTLSELRKSKSASARELEVSLIGVLAEVYRENLVEEGAPLKILIKLAEIVISYFKDLNRKVHESAARAMCDLYTYSLPKSSQQVVFSFMFDPLNSILTTGIDVQVQQAAALTLFTWTSKLSEDKDQGNLILLFSKLLTLFIKIRAEFADLINSIGLLTEICGFSLIVESLTPILTKLTLYLKHPSPNSQSLKISTCRLLAHLGKHLTDTCYNSIHPFPTDLLSILKELRTEKLPALQTAARETLRTWEIYQASLLEQPVQLSPLVNAPSKIFKRIEPESHFRSIRNLVKLQKEKLKANQIPEKEESIWGQGKSGFLKKGTGNYMVVSAQGSVNIAKALENRPKVLENIKKRSVSPTSKISVLYKENSRILEYERDPSPKIFEVQSVSGTNTARPIPPRIPSKEKPNAESEIKDKQKVFSLNVIEEESDIKKNEDDNKREINEGSGEKDKKESEAEGEVEFQGFFKVGTERTYSGQFIGESFHRANSIEEHKLGSIKSSEKEPSTNTSNKTTEQSVPSEINKEPFMKSAALEAREEILMHDPVEISFNKRYDNKIQLEPLQPIEIKPSQNALKPKKRSIFKNCSIEKQEPFIIPQEKHSPKRLLRMENQGQVLVRGILSKEVQTSAILSETPKFSSEINSVVYEPQGVELFESIESQFACFQFEIDEVFDRISLKLTKYEERLEWVGETFVCLMNYRLIKRKFLIKSMKSSAKLEKSNSATQCYEIQEIKESETSGIDKLTQTWNDILRFVERNQLDKAYEELLKTKDDLYLIRLMFKTDCCLGQLKPEISLRIIKQIAQILNSKFIENIGLAWIYESLTTKPLQSSLDSILSSLRNISYKGGEESQEALHLSHQIISYYEKN